MLLHSFLRRIYLQLSPIKAPLQDTERAQRENRESREQSKRLGIFRTQNKNSGSKERKSGICNII